MGTTVMGMLPDSAHAFEDRAIGVYGEAGYAPFGGSSTWSVAAGVLLPWAPSHYFKDGPNSLYWDLFVSGWSAPQPRSRGGGRKEYAQVGAILTWRHRFADVHAPWFFEAGIGATVMDPVYHTPDKRFSTAFQFTEVIGLGRSFGEQGQHELTVRFQHFSNAAIKQPNPGENFLRVRYIYRF